MLPSKLTLAPARSHVYLQFLQATEKAGAVRTLESLARIELGAQGGARFWNGSRRPAFSKSGVATTTVRDTEPPQATGRTDTRKHVLSPSGARAARDT